MFVVTRFTAVAAFLAIGSPVLCAQTTPRAEEIFARHVAAVGGKEAILRVSSIRTVGTMQVVSMGITASIESFAAAPNRIAKKLTIPGIGDISNGFDGTTAWEVNPMQGPRVKTEQEKLMIQDEADFYGALLYPMERFKSAETVGAADFGGEKTWLVKTVLKSGRVVNEYFAMSNGLRVGSQTTQESQTGSVDVTTVQSSYKQFGALMMPTRSETSTGATRMLLTITGVTLGEVSAGAFVLPDQIKALVKPQ